MGKNAKIILASLVVIFILIGLAVLFIQKPSKEVISLDDALNEYYELREQFVLDLVCGVEDFDSPLVKKAQCDPSKMKKGEIIKINFSGLVIDEKGDSIGNAKVTVNNGKSFYTEKNGYFKEEIEVDSIRQAINVVIDKDGYSPFRNIYFAKTVDSEEKTIMFPKDYYVENIILREAEVKKVELDVKKDTTIVSDKHPGLSVTIPAGGLVNSKGEVVTGEVVGEITYLDPNDSDNMLLVPGFNGGDMKQMVGIDREGNQVLIESQGLVFFHLKERGSDEILQPREGVKVTITQPIPEEDYIRMTDPKILKEAQFTEGEVKYYENLGITKDKTDEEKFNIRLDEGLLALNYWHFNKRTGLWESWPIRDLDTDLEKKIYIMKVPAFY